MLKHGLFIGLVLLLAACIHLHKPEPSGLTPWSLHKASHPTPLKMVSPFNRIKIKGHLNVHIHTGSLRPTLLVHGDPRDVSYLKWSVQNETLRVVLDNAYPKYAPVDIDISTDKLFAIVYQGKGSIEGRGLRSPQLDLMITNKGTTILEGQLNLHKVILAGCQTVYIKGGQSQGMDVTVKKGARVQIIGGSGLNRVQVGGHSWLTVYWVSSSQLHVTLKGSARVQIAGTTNQLDAALYGSSRFNGRYLRAKEAFVKTHDDAVADISVTRIQHTLAVDNSNIYYHEFPLLRTDFMGSNGSVIDLKSWEQF